MKDYIKDLMRELDKLKELKAKESKKEKELEEIRDDIKHYEEDIPETAVVIADNVITGEEEDVLNELIRNEEYDRFEEFFRKILDRGDRE